MNNITSVYLNGEFKAPDQAKVSVFDRGFVFGDAIYEVIPVYGKRPFRLPQHLARLGRNLNMVGIPMPLSEAKWSEVLRHLIDDNPAEDQSLYIQISRGVAARDHAFPNGNITPTVVAFSQSLAAVKPELLEHGVTAVTEEDIRWQRCDIKTTALLANVLLRQAAVERGAVEAILVRNDHITEGAASNVIMVDKDNTIITPPKDELILPGITRDLVMQLAAEHDLPHAERAITKGELAQMRELWLTSSTKEILPVTTLDGNKIGNGKPGPVFYDMYKRYQDYKQSFRQGEVE